MTTSWKKTKWTTSHITHNTFTAKMSRQTRGKLQRYKYEKFLPWELEKRTGEKESRGDQHGGEGSNLLGNLRVMKTMFGSGYVLVVLDIP